MGLSMHQASVPLLCHMLKNLASILEKAKAYAAEKGIEEAVLLNARLYPDMFPMTRQVQIATDVATRGADRLAGRDVSNVEDTETSFDELIQRISHGVAHMQSIPAAEIDGSEERDISLDIGGQRMDFKGQAYLLHFIWPNVFFHITTAYDILRHNGLDIGKRDYLTGGASG